MTDKLVTHADLPVLREMRKDWCDGTEEAGCHAHDRCDPHPEANLLDRLIAAAEADAPPLPEGWVLYTTTHDSRAVFWHRDGALYQWQDDDQKFWSVAEVTGRLTPLRPTVTEADVEKAAEALRADFHNYADEVVGWSRAASDVKRAWIKNVRAAFKAAGIEVV